MSRYDGRYCKDCRWLEPDDYTCHAPQNIAKSRVESPVFGWEEREDFKFGPRCEYVRGDNFGCAEEGRWFERRPVAE